MSSEPWLDTYREQATAGQTSLMFDIGANAGEWTLWGCGHFDRVVAVDCDKRAISTLTKQFRDHSKVTVVNAAVTSEPGRVSVYRRPAAEQTSILEVHPIGGAKQADAPVESVEFVEATTIDNMIVEYGEPDFIKIDVEGAEALVLAGATMPAVTKARWLIEVHDTSNEVGLELARLGWEAVQMMRHPMPGAHPGHIWVYVEPLDEET